MIALGSGGELMPLVNSDARVDQALLLGVVPAHPGTPTESRTLSSSATAANWALVY